MILEVKGKEYPIPQKWTEVGLGQYQTFMTESKDIEDANTLDLIAISSFTGLSMRMIEKIRKADIEAVKTHLSTLAKKKLNTTLNTIIEIDGVEYGFHPKLKDITLGEFIDLDNLLEDAWKNMHTIMAILYRPIVKRNKKKYKIEEYDSEECFNRAELFKTNLSVATVNGAANFFFHIGIEYQKIIQSSLRKSEKKTMKKDLSTPQISTQSGVGTE